MKIRPRRGIFESRLAAPLLGVLLVLFTGSALSQSYTPLKAEAGSSGYFIDDVDVNLWQQWGPQQDTSKRIRIDAHAGLQDYQLRSCESCHAEQVNNLHAVRANIGCQQCHGAGEMASISHYFSAMNPIRRHAYVCAKCHEGASASYATYLVHEPASARAAGVLTSFPALYWTDWFMALLILGVFLVFIPHSIGWWLREWFEKRKDGEADQ